MRMMGYPAHKITILTTYNGQKALIRDVIERRCAANPLLGRPYKVGLVGYNYYRLFILYWISTGFALYKYNLLDIVRD